MATYTRDQLYDLVWAKPTVQVGKDIGVSDVAVAKACKRHGIPKPPLGYWAKLQHGHKVSKPPLAKREDDDEPTISIEPRPEHLRGSALSDRTKQRMREEKDEQHKVVVPERL